MFVFLCGVSESEKDAISVLAWKKKDCISMWCKWQRKGICFHDQYVVWSSEKLFPDDF